MRRVRILCENGGGTVRVADGMIDCNRNHDAAPPMEKPARSSIVPSPDVGWGPKTVCSMSNRLRLIVGFKRIDPNKKAQIAQRNTGHGEKATDIRNIRLLLTEVGEQGDNPLGSR